MGTVGRQLGHERVGSATAERRLIGTGGGRIVRRHGETAYRGPPAGIDGDLEGDLQGAAPKEGGVGQGRSVGGELGGVGVVVPLAGLGREGASRAVKCPLERTWGGWGVG